MMSDAKPHVHWRFRPARPDDEPGLLALFEEFWELDATNYSRLHTHLPDDGEWFRGMRYDPWTDPLAYLVGRSARRHLFVEAGAVAATRTI